MKRVLRTTKPLKIWIDGTCFEVNNPHNKHKSAILEVESHSPVPVQYEIVKNDAGKFFTSFRLPNYYYAKLLELPDWENLQNKTNTIFQLPKPHGLKLTITGDTEDTIIKARNEIHSLVYALRDSVPARQFISIPLRNDEIIANFETFKRNILNGDRIEGMDESIFQNPLKLHLTVVVFALMDEYEKSEAIKTLQDYKDVIGPVITKNGPIKIRVSGIDCMNANHKKVDVLYANAKIANESTELTLQKVVNDLSEHFYNKGLVRTYQDNVKLHMTLINTKYRKDSNTPKKKRWNKRQSFNATSILEKYKDFDFGESDFDAIHLSLMGAVGDDGFYESIAAIKLT